MSVPMKLAIADIIASNTEKICPLGSVRFTGLFRQYAYLS
jgi:hypothetical protein